MLTDSSLRVWLTFYNTDGAWTVMLAPMQAERVDVAIVGGGPAGLSAALMLGRCLRRVVVIDAGEHRNRKAHAIHGYLTRDGTAPTDLLRLAETELLRYPTVRLNSGIVTGVDGARGAFVVRTADGAAIAARRVLLATGVIDVIPVIAGLPELYGRSVHHCPHCDGFEYAGRPIGVYGQAGFGVEAALAMLAWSDDVVLFTDGRPLTSEDRRRCEAQGVTVRDERVVRLEGQGGQLERVVLAGGEAVARRALFLVAGQREQSDLAKLLGCELNADGIIVADEHSVTSVPGVYVAGDASIGEQLVVVAAAQGAIAATKIHASLHEEDLRQRVARS
jgi:thioredoxin reductase